MPQGTRLACLQEKHAPSGIRADSLLICPVRDDARGSGSMPLWAWLRGLRPVALSGDAA